MRWAWVLLLAVSVLSPPSLAQAPETGPEVRFPDATIEEQIKPLGPHGTTEVDIAIGCAAVEGAQWTTQAEIVAQGPSSANPIVSPSSASWIASPGDCPSNGTPFQTTSQVRVSLTQNAPAFAEQRIHLAMNVTKAPPGSDVDPQRYGPYHANVTYTPGYFSLFNTRLEKKIARAEANETVEFPIEIENFSNDETRFGISVTTPPTGVEVETEPGSLVLDTQDRGTATILVEVADPEEAPIGEPVSLEATVTGNSTTRPSAEGSPSTVSMKVQFDGGPTEAAGAPGPGLTLLALAAGLAVGLRRDPDR